MNVEIRMSIRASVVHPCDCTADWDLIACCCPASQESIVPSGKDQNPECKVQFLLNMYCLCTTIIAKSYVKPYKSGTSALCHHF